MRPANSGVTETNASTMAGAIHSHSIINETRKSAWLKGLAVIEMDLYRHFYRQERTPFADAGNAAFCGATTLVAPSSIISNHTDSVRPRTLTGRSRSRPLMPWLKTNRSACRNLDATTAKTPAPMRAARALPHRSPSPSQTGLTCVPIAPRPSGWLEPEQRTQWSRFSGIKILAAPLGKG